MLDIRWIANLNSGKTTLEIGSKPEIIRGKKAIEDNYS
jgi:hypothetical protein